MGVIKKEEACYLTVLTTSTSKEPPKWCVMVAKSIKKKPPNLVCKRSPNPIERNPKKIHLKIKPPNCHQIKHPNFLHNGHHTHVIRGIW